MGRSCRMGTRILDVTFSRNPFMRKTMKMIDFIKSHGLYDEFLIEKKKTAKEVQKNRGDYFKKRYSENKFVLKMKRMNIISEKI